MYIIYIYGTTVCLQLIIPAIILAITARLIQMMSRCHVTQYHAMKSKIEENLTVHLAVHCCPATSVVSSAVSVVDVNVMCNM